MYFQYIMNIQIITYFAPSFFKKNTQNCKHVNVTEHFFSFGRFFAVSWSKDIFSYAVRALMDLHHASEDWSAQEMQSVKLKSLHLTTTQLLYEKNRLAGTQKCIVQVV